MIKQTSLNLWAVDHEARKFTSNPTKKAILAFLGKGPLKIQLEGESAMAELALCVGNLLCQLAGDFDENNGPNFHADLRLGEIPDNIKALGQQFQEVGRRMMARPGTSQIEARISALGRRLDSLEEKAHPPQLIPDPQKNILVPDFLTEKHPQRKHVTDLALYRRGCR